LCVEYTKYYYNDETEENQMGGACSTESKNEKYAHSFGLKA